VTGRLRSGGKEELKEELSDFLFLGATFLISLFSLNNSLFI
jgi:hypothetical protein